MYIGCGLVGFGMRIITLMVVDRYDHSRNMINWKMTALLRKQSDSVICMKSDDIIQQH